MKTRTSNKSRLSLSFVISVALLASELGPCTFANAVHQRARPDDAPTWAIPYGKEFWRRLDSRARAQEVTPPTAKLISSRFNLGDIVERVSHAFVLDEQSSLPTVKGRTYTASFDDRGLIVSPRLPRNEPSLECGGKRSATPLWFRERWTGRPARKRCRGFALPPQSKPGSLSPCTSEESWRLPRNRSVEQAFEPARTAFRTASVRHGDESLYLADETTAVWSFLGNTAQALLEPRGGLIEHYEARADGVAVTWVASRPPPGRGPLIIEVEFSGVSHAGQTASGHHFADETGTARLRFGNAFAVDSSGERWNVSVHVEEDHLLVTVPEAILSSATYPLAIDPLISPEFEMDQPVLGPADRDQSVPVVGTNGSDYLVVWSDTRSGASTIPNFIFGARIGADGANLDPYGIFISQHNAVSFQVASNGKDYLVAWIQGSIRGVRVSRDGKVLDSPELDLWPLRPGWASYGQFVLASNGSDYLVAMAGRPTFSTPESDVYAVRISESGALLDAPAIPVCTARGEQFFNLAAGSNGRDYLVVWHDGRESPAVSLFGARVRSDGASLDLDGFRISPALRSRQFQVSIASDRQDYLVAWGASFTNGEITAARIGADGNVSAPALIATNAQLGATVATEPGTYQVLWNGPAGLHATTLRADGQIGNPDKLPAELGFQGQIVSNGKGYLSVWTANGPPSLSGYDIFGTLVQGLTNGATAKSIAVSTSANAQRFAVLTSGSTNTLVVWQDTRFSESGGSRLYGVRLSPEGSVLDPTGIPISPAGLFVKFDVASNGREFLVAWSEWSGAIVGVRVPSAGGPVSNSILIQQASNGRSTARDLCLASNGADYLAVWHESSAYDVLGARISGEGKVLDTAGLSIAGLEGYQGFPAVASDGKDYLVVWRELSRRTAQATSTLFGTRVTAEGRILDPGGFVITQGLTTWAYERNPVAFNGERYLVVWEDWRNVSRFSPTLDFTMNVDIRGSWVSRAGVVSDLSGIPICTAAGSQSAPAVAGNGSDFLRGDLLVVWADGRNGSVSGNDIYGTRVSADGAVLDGAGLMIDSSPFDQRIPSVTYTGRGQFLVLNQGFKHGADRVQGNSISIYEPVVVRQGKVMLSFSAESGKKYRVQFKQSLQAGNWTDLSGDIVASGSTVTKVDDTAGGVAQRFYRLIQVP